MVDRITPATTKELLEELERDFGIIDGWPIVAEDFTQWVVEENFSAGRPKWENVGALFVEDVIPYELMKLRLLNGSHQGLAYVSYVHGFRAVDKATRDPLMRRFIRGFMDECTSTVPEVPGVDLEQYKQTLIERYSNQLLSDQVYRLCEDGSNRMNVSVNPCVQHKLQAGASDGEIGHLALATAGWIRYLCGSDESGEKIIIQDNNSNANALIGAASAALDSESCGDFLQKAFGPQGSEYKQFENLVNKYFTSIKQKGVYPTIDEFLN